MKKRYLWLWCLPVLAFLRWGKSELYDWLALTDRVAAPVLVVEGWIDRPGLEAAAAEIATADYQRVVVASLAFPFDSTHAFQLSNEGGLVFDLARWPSPIRSDSVIVRAAGEALHRIPAHFQLWVNDSLVGEAWTSEYLRSYPFALPDSTPVRQVTVVFDNDGFAAGVGDRNLLVQSVRVGETTYYARTSVAHYDEGEIDGQEVKRTDHRSEADQSADLLRQLGVPDSILTTVAAPVTDYNRTYAMATAVRAWFEKQPGPTPLAINMCSAGAHARRSRWLYQKAWGPAVQCGVVAVPQAGIRAENWWQEKESLTYTVEQLAKYVYARCCFWPDE